MVVCSPTGSGKTVVFELAIIRLLMNFPDRAENFKIVYSKYWWVLITVAGCQVVVNIKLVDTVEKRKFKGPPIISSPELYLFACFTSFLHREWQSSVIVSRYLDSLRNRGKCSSEASKTQNVFPQFPNVPSLVDPSPQEQRVWQQQNYVNIFVFEPKHTLLNFTCLL